MLPLTKDELKSYQDAKVCNICGKRILNKFCKCINIGKLEIIINIQRHI